MPDARNIGQRLAPGWITKTALLAGSYLITEFAVQTDQSEGGHVLIPWVPPARPNETPNYSNREKMLTGQVRQFGFSQFNWKFSYWTFDMVSYVLSTFYSDLTKSAAVTVGTYDATDTFVALQCYLGPLVLPGPSGEAEYGGFKNVLLEFSGGQVVT